MIFGQANIEFIEFLDDMDPFNSEDGLINHNGGDMYINLEMFLRMFSRTDIKVLKMDYQQVL